MVIISNHFIISFIVLVQAPLHFARNMIIYVYINIYLFVVSLIIDVSILITP